jgi:hypothetical protein
VNSTNEHMLAIPGNFACWKVEIANGFGYEVRRAAEVYERFNSERKALEVMRVMDRIEV